MVRTAGEEGDERRHLVRLGDPAQRVRLRAARRSGAGQRSGHGRDRPDRSGRARSGHNSGLNRHGPEQPFTSPCRPLHHQHLNCLLRHHLHRRPLRCTDGLYTASIYTFGLCLRQLNRRPLHHRPLHRRPLHRTVVS